MKMARKKLKSKLNKKNYLLVRFEDILKNPKKFAKICHNSPSFGQNLQKMRNNFFTRFKKVLK